MRDPIEVACDLIAELDPGHPVRVAVDGITAVGKTTFADALATALMRRDRSVVRVSMDGFHYPRAVRYRQGRTSAAGYYEDGYDLASVRRVLLDPLGPQGDRRYRSAVIDLATDTPIDGPVLTANPDDVLVVDGSFLQKPILRDAWDLVVYLHAGFAAAEERGVARDADLLGSTEAAPGVPKPLPRRPASLPRRVHTGSGGRPVHRRRGSALAPARRPRRRGEGCDVPVQRSVGGAVGRSR